MKRVNKLMVGARRVVSGRKILESACVEIRGGRIENVFPCGGRQVGNGLDHFGELLIPGMIDLHVNGAGGGDAAEGTFEALEKMSLNQAAHGVTGFLATIISNHAEALLQSLTRLGAVVGDHFSGAVPLGVHLEGPFLSPEKRGAHPLECLQAPTLRQFEAFHAASRGRLKMLTLAPELEGGLKLISRAREELPIVSLGHSNADYATTLRALEAGANLATHLFNAMPNLHHREPTLLGAVLDEAVPVELIADGIHVHPAVVRLAARCKGAEGLVLVTDAIAAAGMPDGEFRIGDLDVTVRGGVCRLTDGRLAGSTLTMDLGLKNLHEWLKDLSGLDLPGVAGMASTLPARLLGLPNKGRIEPGCDADLVLLDHNWRVEKTWCGGRLVYKQPTVSRLEAFREG